MVPMVSHEKCPRAKSGSVRFLIKKMSVLILSWIGYLSWILINSVQAEKKKIATTTFLDAWDLRSHMAGHFHLWHAVFSYHPGLLGPSS